MLSRYEAVLAALRAGVVIHAADTEILEANERARVLLGIQNLEGRLATDPGWVFMEADHTPMPLERFPVMQVISTGGPVESLAMIIRPPLGSETTLEVNALPVFDDTGALEQVVVTFIDVTDRADAERALAASRELLRVVLDNAGQSILRIDQDLRVDYVNEAVVTALGVSAEALLGRRLAAAEPVDGITDFDWEEAGRAVLASGEPDTFECRAQAVHGDRWHELTFLPQFDDDRRVTHVIITDRDVTERKQAEAALRARQAQYEAAHLLANFGSWAMDLATGRITWSEELFRMHGLDTTQSVPDLSEQQRLYPPESWARLHAAMRSAEDEGVPYQIELETRRPDGSTGWMLARGEPVRDAGGTIIGLQGVAVDTTESRRAAAELVLLTTHDPLTGLPNRTSMVDEITRATRLGQESGHSTAVLMLDLDHFKDVNDTLGHAAGDELLTAAAVRISSGLHNGGFVARFGGDEFAVVIPDIDDQSEAVLLAGHLLEEFHRPFAIGGAELYATASIGVAVTMAAGEPHDLVREADTAMHAAKAHGRNRVVVFNEDLRAAVAARLAVETDLRRCLEREQLAVWYQPEVDLATGEVVALEALLRWHHPDGTVWSAFQFIDIAEDTGLILDIGDWVLAQACAHGAACAHERPERPPIVRVNVSALQLAEDGLLPAIDSAMDASGLDPALLCIEITETTLLRETPIARANIEGIHARGIGIAIDDFGTGYASLTYLNTYPIDVLKIDRSFIMDIPDDHRLVPGIIALATTLGITVTAEGVEHPHQASYLRTMGCPSAQGWLYSKAVPPEALMPLLTHIFPHG